MNKMWKNDGEEQEHLEKLFREKQVNSSMKPSDVQKKHEKFHGFTASVFRKHWNNTKLMFAAKITCDRNAVANDEIIEIDGPSPPPAKLAKTTHVGGIAKDNVTFIQAPIVSTVYTDPDTKQDVCFVIISLLSKINRVDFDVFATDDGQMLKVTYSWPKYTYDGEEMFKKDGDAKTFVNKLHPKFLAVEKALEAVRENFQDAPLGTIEVRLPANIQLDPSTWKNYFNKKADGTLLVFFEFLCVRSEYIIKKVEKSIILE